MIAVLVALAFATPLVGTAAADDHADHGVSIDTEALAADSSATIEVTITNPNESAMVSPIVEIPLRTGLDVAENDRLESSDYEAFLDGVTVDTGSGTEDRTAFIDESTIRGGTSAVFVEGVEVPANNNRTYAIPMTVTGSSEVTIEADTRPLNFESRNNRTSKTIDPVSPGTLDIGTSSDVTVSGSGISDQTVSSDTEVNVPGNQQYDLTATISSIGFTFENVQVDEFETQPARFSEPSEASPTVVARTGSQADVVEGSASRSTDRGTATARTTQTVTFDLSASGGQTAVTVGTESDLPMDSLASTSGIDSSQFSSDTALLEIDGAVDGTATATFDGRYIGDETGDDSVDAADAAEIADRLAAGTEGELTGYADVTDSGSVSAVDAMQIQQYDEGNRSADYTIDGGAS